jgi:hypothetical protein
MSIMLTEDLVEIELFCGDAADGADFLELRDITLPKNDPLAGFSLGLNRADRKRLIAILLEADK